MSYRRQLYILMLFFFSYGVAFATPGQPVEQKGNLPKQDASLYAIDPQPLTLEQCGQCHPHHYSDLKNAGGRHQLNCAACHNKHKQILQCIDCHTSPHLNSKKLLEKYPRCLDCHLDVHDLPIK